MNVRRACLALFLAAIATTALAAPDFPEGKWWKRPRLAAAIGLTAEQSREIEKIFVRARTRLIDLKADLEKKQLVLQESMEDHSADRRAVEKQIESVENARAELQKARALMLLDIKQVLKPQQWERLLLLQQEFRERRMMRQEGQPENYGTPPPPDRRPPRRNTPD